ncbi:MAG TPA: PEP-CTERM/exosortase system-associated acyltransferase [Stellaceae bacterium]|nr:PEP-CTERM/exosortase system-associated acyltransferase [Stellaceae bacterium]
MQQTDCAFTVVPADSRTLRDCVHRLRYQAYCVENPFEDATKHPRRLETDEYDERAVHSLLVHSPTNIPVGCVRLIVHDASDDEMGPLPIRHACGELDTLDDLCSPGRRVGEVSRFCLSREALGEAQQIVRTEWGVTRVPRAHDSFTATLALLSAVVGMSVAEDVSHICALMAPTLLRLFAGFGLRLAPLGPAVEHHGLRMPVYSHLGDLLAGARRVRPDAWAVITRNGALRPTPSMPMPVLEAVA